MAAAPESYARRSQIVAIAQKSSTEWIAVSLSACCQKLGGRFILDFYCPSQKLAIEVDGGVHDEQAEYDAVRTEQVETYGYRVLRFTNEAVMADLDGVLEEIRRAIL